MMKLILETTGQEHRLIKGALGLALEDAKKRRSEIDKKQKPITYDNIDYEVKKYAELFTKF